MNNVFITRAVLLLNFLFVKLKSRHNKKVKINDDIAAKPISIPPRSLLPAAYAV